MGFVIFAIDPVYEVEWTPDDIALYEQELLKISQLYLNRLREGKNAVVKPLDDALRIFSLEERQSPRCGLATTGVGIDPRGNIYACPPVCWPGVALSSGTYLLGGMKKP